MNITHNQNTNNKKHRKLHFGSIIHISDISYCIIIISIEFVLICFDRAVIM